LPAATYTTPRVIDDICQREHYFYDTNPFDATFTQNSKGRLTAVQYRGGYNATASPTCDIVFTEMYSYGAPGNITKKRLRTTRGTQPDLDLDSTYAYDTEGRNTSIQYPGTWNGSSYTAGPNLGVEFDAMGRLNKLKNLTASTDIVSGATYNAMGELLTMTGVNGAPSEYTGEPELPARNRQHPCLLHNRNLLDEVELRELLLQIRVPLLRNLALLRSLTILRIDLVHHVHPLHHLAERSEPRPIQSRVVRVIDEELRRARVRARCRERHPPARIRHPHRIVRNPLIFPLRIHLRIRTQPELHHKPRHHTKEAATIQEV
jgi:hypothetical protein